MVLSTKKVISRMVSNAKITRPAPATNATWQAPVTIWLTGLSGSGKSTLALALAQRIRVNGRSCYVLDGDKLRQGLNRDLGFSAGDRSENIRRVAEVAKLMNDAGLMVITAFISPYRLDRELASDIIGQDNFFEVHLSTPLEACEQRDVKGLYKKARAGEIKEFTGVSAPYEAPLQPFVSLDTSLISVEDSVMRLYKILSQKTVFTKPNY
jgi:adenylyl-sulfate kinase